jgi:hypothetical protein
MRRHRFDPISLLFGGLFVLVAAVFLFGDPDLTSVRMQWVWPLGVIVLGALIILVALARGRGDGDARAEPAPAEPALLAAAPDESWHVASASPDPVGTVESDAHVQLLDADTEDDADDDAEEQRPSPSVVFDEDATFSGDRFLP